MVKKKGNIHKYMYPWMDSQTHTSVSAGVSKPIKPYSSAMENIPIKIDCITKDDQKEDEKKK